jgi:hypothetical protein
MFHVKHWNGRPCSWPRILYAGADEQRARAVYQRELETLRLGVIRLVADGAIVCHTWAPRPLMPSQPGRGQ